jgi:hypothetical protein
VLLSTEHEFNRKKITVVRAIILIGFDNVIKKVVN